MDCLWAPSNEATTMTTQRMRHRVALVGALDSKYEEYAYLRQRLAEHGVDTELIDIGVLSEPGVQPDIQRSVVAAAAGADIADLAARGDRNAAMTAMATGASAIVAEHYRQRSISGVMVAGGSNAGYVMSRLAAVLPIGCPKVLVSTIVAGDTRPYVQGSDLIMLYPVVDLAGLNSVSSPILARAADVLAGIVTAPPVANPYQGRTAVGCTMFGVTTPCVSRVHDQLTDQGFEVQVFHANGTGGRTLEKMITGGAFAAVADITTTELADDLLGGVCSAGPDRLTAAARAGIPQVVSVGALDMVNFGPRETVPERFASRKLFEHNPTVTLMRTSPPECAQLGKIIADRLNAATGPVEVHIPARGFSQISVAEGPFHDRTADEALIETLRSNLAERVPLTVHDLAVNDPGFAAIVAQVLTDLLINQNRN